MEFSICIVLFVFFGIAGSFLLEVAPNFRNFLGIFAVALSGQWLRSALEWL